MWRAAVSDQFVLVKEYCLHLSDLRTVKIHNCEKKKCVTLYKTTEKWHKPTSRKHKNFRDAQKYKLQKWQTNYKVTKLQKEKTWNYKDTKTQTAQREKLQRCKKLHQKDKFTT